MNDFDNSEHAFSRALALAEQFEADFPHTSISWQALEGLATLLSQQGKDQQAEPAARQYVERTEKAIREIPKDRQPPFLSTLLLQAYRRHGQILLGLGRREEAEVESRRSLQLAGQLAEERGDEKSQREYTLSARDLVRCLLAQNKREEALPILQKICRSAEKRVADNPQVVGFRSDLGTIYKLLATVYQETDPEDALSWLHKSAEMFEEVQDGWEGVRPALADVYRTIGSMQTKTEPREAIPWFQKAIDIGHGLCDEHPDVAVYKQMLVDLTCSLAGSYAMLEEYSNALDQYNQALVINPEHTRACTIVRTCIGKWKSTLKRSRIFCDRSNCDRAGQSH